MRRVPALTIVLLAVMRLSPVVAQTPDFSGTWVLDRGASEISEAAGLAVLGAVDAPERLHVTHAANGDLALQSEWNTSEARVFRPGRETVIPVGPDDTLAVTSRWEGDTLLAEGRRERAGGGSSILGVRRAISLSPDGAHLTIEATTTTAEGSATSRLVYGRLRDLGPCEQWSEPCTARP